MPKIVDHDKRRHEIALAACRAIAKKGLDAVTLADIAKESGYTTGMLAHYYSTKWDVILAALRLMHDRLEKRLSQRLNGQEIDLVDLLKDALPTNPEHRAESAAWLTFWGVAIGRPHLLKWSAKIHSDWRALVRYCVVETTPGARSWPPDLIEDVVSSIIFFMDGLYVKALTRASVYPPKDQVRLLRAHVDALMSWAAARVPEAPKGGIARGAPAPVAAPTQRPSGRRIKAAPTL